MGFSCAHSIILFNAHRENQNRTRRQQKNVPNFLTMLFAMLLLAYDMWFWHRVWRNWIIFLRFRAQQKKMDQFQFKMRNIFSYLNFSFVCNHTLFTDIELVVLFDQLNVDCWCKFQCVWVWVCFVYEWTFFIAFRSHWSLDSVTSIYSLSNR